MTSPRRLLAATVATTALLAGLTACGDNDKADTSSAAEPADPADSSSTDDTSSDDSTDEDSTGEDSTDTGADSDAAESPAGGAVFVDITDTPAATVMIGEAGFDPGSVSVGVGDVVKFSCGDESGVYGVVVGDLSGYTVTGGIDEFFRFDKPGTYEVVEEISEATMTVTVE